MDTSILWHCAKNIEAGRTTSKWMGSCAGDVRSGIHSTLPLGRIGKVQEGPRVSEEFRQAFPSGPIFYEIESIAKAFERAASKHPKSNISADE
jgi:hypothetical protein